MTFETDASRLARDLGDRQKAINRELARNGVRFGIYKDGSYHDRLFPYDPIPRVIASDEYDRLEKGLKQRVDALNAYLRDIYSEKRIVHDGVVPEELVYTSSGYLPQVNGVTPPGGIYAHIAGEDLVQAKDGTWLVLEDNLRIPSGASYPLFAREIERRANPHLFRDVRVRDNRDYPRLLRRAMDFVSCGGIACVLTPGRCNSAFFEHAYLAEKTGAELAFPEDLTVEDNKVYLVDYAGTRHRVGVIYRRLSDEFLDPFAFNPDSVIGVPGLLAAYRSGNVAIVNAPGNGAADDKAIYYFVPAMVRYYLGEEPILKNAPTYMPLLEEDRKIVLDRLGELVIKDVSEAGGYGVVFGSSLDAEGRERMADAIRSEPRRFIAQEVVDFRDIDVIDPETGERSPRKCDLRAFVVTGRSTHVWYSGLTRYAAREGEMIVNSSQGGGFKDTWVLAPGGRQKRQVDVADRIRTALDQARLRTLALVPASKAENLYWLGRYTERVFTTLNLFFPYYDRVMDTDVEAFRPFAAALDLPRDFEDFDSFIESLLFDKANLDSVASALEGAFRNATVLRPELGSSQLAYIELALANIAAAAGGKETGEAIFSQRNVTDDILAFWGGIENSAADASFKSLVFMGKYIERLDLYTRFRLPESMLEPALEKLSSYIGLLESAPLPLCYAEGLALLSSQMRERGAAGAAVSLDQVIGRLSGRVVEVPARDPATLSSMNMDAVRP